MMVRVEHEVAVKPLLFQPSSLMDSGLNFGQLRGNLLALFEANALLALSRTGALAKVRCRVSDACFLFFLSDHFVVVSVITVLFARALAGHRLSCPLHGSRSDLKKITRLHGNGA